MLLTRVRRRQGVKPVTVTMAQDRVTVSVKDVYSGGKSYSFEVTRADSKRNPVGNILQSSFRVGLRFLLLLTPNSVVRVVLHSKRPAFVA